jgi:hypothetical protein
MSTFQDIQNRIASDLMRTDLTSQIANAVTDAIQFYERQRFWFNVTRLLTFSTNPSQSAYTGTDLAQIPHIVKIDALFLPQNTSIYPLDRYEPPDFEVVSAAQGGGRPTCFTYSDQSILLWPIPDAAYTMRLHCHFKFPQLVNPTDTNPWVNEAEQLIRTHAKALIHTDVLEDDEAAQRQLNKVPGLIDDLKYEASARRANGEIKGTDF